MKFSMPMSKLISDEGLGIRLVFVQYSTYENTPLT